MSKPEQIKQRSTKSDLAILKSDLRPKESFEPNQMGAHTWRIIEDLERLPVILAKLKAYQKAIKRIEEIKRQRFGRDCDPNIKNAHTIVEGVVAGFNEHYDFVGDILNDLKEELEGKANE